MIKRIECKVTGRVQLVMFRDFTKRNARHLGLLGTVKNEKDGSVSVEAEGEEEKLKDLVDLLYKGSILSKVVNVDTLWMEPKNEFSDFKIVY